MSTMGEGPLARSTDLIIEELGDEVLVYDTTIDRGHTPQPGCGEGLACCDGRTSAEELSAKLGLDPETVDRALDELERLRAARASRRRCAGPEGSTRREVTSRWQRSGPPPRLRR